VRRTRPTGSSGPLLALLALLLTGCGYALVGRATNIPDDIKNVHVETLVNQTQRSQLEQILTRAIADEMVTRRRFNVVNSPADADAVLRGTVISFSVRPVAFDGDGIAESFEVTITADMRFQRVPAAGELAEEAEIVWRNSRYVFRQDYDVGEAGLEFFDRELSAIEATAERFAETLVTDLLEGF